MNTIIDPNLAPSTVDAVLSCARGCYQQALLEGRARRSGADLRGRASRYGARYAYSRRALRARVASVPGVRVRETRGAHGLRVVVIEAAS